MSGSDVPGRDDRTRRVHRDDPDATRQVDTGATGRVDPGATRRIDPDDAHLGADRTQQLDPTTGYGDDDGYVTVPNRPPGEPRADEEAYVEEEPAPARRRGRDWAIGLGGVVAGVLLAVIVAFLAGGDRPVDDEVAAAEERIAALEAERDDLVAQNEALEARATDAEAAAGRTDDDLAAQRGALDDRAAALDGRAEALDQRESALDDRESNLDDRAATLDDREAELDRRDAEEPAGDGGGDGTGDGGGDGGVGDLVPDADEVEGFVDRVLERIRDLF